MDTIPVEPVKAGGEIDKPFFGCTFANWFQTYILQER